ncbi:hypothetical protein BJG94_25240 [Rhizobium sp. Td3]|nr:hypothetical protein BJG94_25240 [Rhizobium sp. Td3]
MFDMVKAPETVMRRRLSALPLQEQYGQRDLPVKLRRDRKKRHFLSAKSAAQTKNRAGRARSFQTQAKFA